VDSRDRDLSPKGVKAKGLLTLIAFSPEYSRTRQWLQDKLWSDRSKDQASGSLRTCLNEIRKAFKEHRSVLISDRVDVGLARDRFVVDFTTEPDSVIGTSHEPLEGLDINDREFEHVIRDIRASIIDRHVPAQVSTVPSSSPLVDVVIENAGGLLAEVVSDTVVNRITSTLNLENGVNTVVRKKNYTTSARPFTTCRIRSFEMDGEVYVKSSVSRASDGSEIWSSDLAVQGTPSEIVGNIKLGRFVLQVIDKITSTLVTYNQSRGLGAAGVYSLEAQAIDLLFQLDQASLSEADRIFALAYDTAPKGQYLAWRAFLRNLAFFQHRRTDFLKDNTSTLELSFEAVRQAPDHPLVQGIASQLDYIHQGDLATSLSIADLAVQSDSTSPLTWAFYSNALVANKRFREGAAAASNAIALSAGSRTQFFFHHFACMAAVSHKDYEGGMAHAQSALRFRPDFVSTRRYELAIATHLNKPADYAHSLAMMKKYEHGFAADMLLDPSYPVTTMRRLPLIDSVNDYLQK